MATRWFTTKFGWKNSWLPKIFPIFFFQFEWEKNDFPPSLVIGGNMLGDFFSSRPRKKQIIWQPLSVFPPKLDDKSPSLLGNFPLTHKRGGGVQGVFSLDPCGKKEFIMIFFFKPLNSFLITSYGDCRS
jgi:hypothetical protein